MLVLGLADLCSVLVIMVVVMVEVWKRIADVFDLELRTCMAKIEGMHLDRANEGWQADLLEFVVYEGADALSQSFTVRTGCDGFPVDVN